MFVVVFALGMLCYAFCPQDFEKTVEVAEIAAEIAE